MRVLRIWNGNFILICTIFTQVNVQMTRIAPSVVKMLLTRVILIMVLDSEPRQHNLIRFLHSYVNYRYQFHSTSHTLHVIYTSPTFGDWSIDHKNIHSDK